MITIVKGLPKGMLTITKEYEAETYAMALAAQKEE
jgi:hypothetical protein